MVMSSLAKMSLTLQHQHMPDPITLAKDDAEKIH